MYLAREVKESLRISPEEVLDVSVVGEKIVLERKRGVGRSSREIFKLKKHVER